MCLVALSSCASPECSLPKEWRLASSLRPSPVPYTPKLVFYAQEMEHGQWRWRDKRVTYDLLLRDVAVIMALNPQPLVLFNFADGHSCRELNRMREEIAKAAKCSEEGVPCLQGTMAEFEAHT